MSIHRYLLLLVALVLSACASSAGTRSAQGGETATRTARGNSTLIVRAELAELEGRTAWDAVEIIRRRWLQPGRGGTVVAGPMYARVVVEGTTRGDLDELRIISTDEIEIMRFLSAADATTKYGTGYPAGVIEVTLR